MKRLSLVQFVFKSAAFQENNIYTFKIHLFSFLNIKQSNQVFFRARIDKSLTWQ